MSDGSPRDPGDARWRALSAASGVHRGRAQPAEGGRGLRARPWPGEDMDAPRQGPPTGPNLLGQAGRPDLPRQGRSGPRHGRPA
ncbi:MAG TPA: hypothetical protein VGS19_33530, partial [Streptosporangiaceae bacterium]|nr:hypothetical protein [Streptosporangiaceae bacterium]